MVRMKFARGEALSRRALARLALQYGQECRLRRRQRDADARRRYKEACREEGKRCVKPVNRLSVATTTYLIFDVIEPFLLGNNVFGVDVLQGVVFLPLRLQVRFVAFLRERRASSHPWT